MSQFSARNPRKEASFCEGKMKAAALGACLVVVMTRLFEAPAQNRRCPRAMGFIAVSIRWLGTDGRSGIEY
jgi:hypothetical protein